MQISPAVRAMDDRFVRLNGEGGLRGNLDVAAGADAVFQFGEGDAVLAFEEARVLVEQILVEPLGECGASVLKFLHARLDACRLGAEFLDLGLKLCAFLGVFPLGFSDNRAQALGLLHELQFAILDVDDHLFRSGDLVAKRGEFLVFSGLKLLAFVSRDGVPLGLGFDFEGFPLDFDFLHARPGGFKPGGRAGDLLLLGCALAGDGVKLELKRADPLVAILESEQFFDFGKHSWAGIVADPIPCGEPQFYRE